LACQLWALKEGGAEVTGLDDILHLAASGRTSIPVNDETPKALYRAAGFRDCGTRAVRVDILERLADLIRPAIQYRPGVTVGEPPAGTADGDAFVPTITMTSLCGCAGEDFASILKSLGYVMERRTGPAITKELAKPASMEPISAVATEASVTPAEVEASEPEAVVETTPPEQAPVTEIIAEVPEAAEPVMVEVWRQHRQRPHAPRHQRNRPQVQRTGASGAAPADASADATKNDRPRHDRPRHEREKRTGDDQNRDQRKPRAEVSEERRGPRPPRRDDKRNDRRPQENRGWQDPPKARADNKAPDPDSPFAKLLALKAEMESKGKKG
jgi:ATP-dependent RNA helicase SUPV3L1/SUV3